jgi:hypothetical protein
VVPHFLSYDLSILAVAGVVMQGRGWPEVETLRLKRVRWLYLLSVNAYVVLFMFVSARLAQPLLLVAILVFLYVWLLGIARDRIMAPAVD